MDPVADTTSEAFGDQEFLHEIGGYGTADPLLKAAIREYGAGISKVVPEIEMTNMGTKSNPQYARGETLSKHPYDNWLGRLFGKTPYTYVNEEAVKFVTPQWPHRTDVTTGEMYLPTERERLNDLWRHEYRHQGMDLLRERQDRSLFNRTLDFLGHTYTAPVDYDLEKIFNPGWDNTLSKVFGLSGKRRKNDEEALMRVMDLMYGKSDFYKGKARAWLNEMGHKGLIANPDSWRRHFVIGDPNNFLNTFDPILNRNP